MPPTVGEGKDSCYPHFGIERLGVQVVTQPAEWMSWSLGTGRPNHVRRARLRFSSFPNAHGLSCFISKKWRLVQNTSKMLFGYRIQPINSTCHCFCSWPQEPSKCAIAQGEYDQQERRSSHQLYKLGKQKVNFRVEMSASRELSAWPYKVHQNDGGPSPGLSLEDFPLSLARGSTSSGWTLSCS